MHTSPQSRISPTVLSGTLIAVSTLWFVLALVFNLTNQDSKDGVFGAPVWDLLSITVIPFAALVFAPWLVVARRLAGQRLRAIDYFALIAGITPLACIGILFLILFFSR
jgi:hypothetical protein